MLHCSAVVHLLQLLNPGPRMKTKRGRIFMVRVLPKFDLDRRRKSFEWRDGWMVCAYGGSIS